MGEGDGPKSIFSEASRLKKYLASFAVFYCSFSLGITGTFLNVSTVDFSKKFEVSVDTVSIVFSVLSLASLLGAFFSGVAMTYLHIPRQLCVMCVLALMAVPLFALPHVESVYLYYGLAAAMGFGGGSLDVAQVAWIIDIWRHEAGPFILTQHFAYSLGTLVPPLIQGPYLSEEQGDDQIVGTSTTESPYESQLYIPFTIGGCIVFVSIVLQLCLYFFAFRRPTTSRKADEQTETELEPRGQEILAEDASQSNFWLSKRQLLLILLVCCVIGFYQGLELCTGQFIPTFAQFSEVGLSEKKAADVAFGMQLGFASGRLLGILIVLKVAPHFILAGNFLLMLLSNIVLLVWAGSNVTWLWIGSVAIGLGMSTVYPASYAFIEKYIFVADSVAATVSICGGSVAFIYPIIVGNWIETNPEVMTYVNFLSLFMCVVAFAVLFFVTHVRSSRKRKMEDNKD